MTEQKLREKIVRIIDKAFDDFARDATSDVVGYIADALISARIGDVSEYEYLTRRSSMALLSMCEEHSDDALYEYGKRIQQAEKELQEERKDE